MRYNAVILTVMILLIIPIASAEGIASESVKEANSWRTEWQCNDSIVNHECTVKLCNVDLWSILSGSRTFETALKISDTSFAGAPSYQIYSWQNVSHDATERTCKYVKQECVFTEEEAKEYEKTDHIFNMSGGRKPGDAYDCSYDDCKDNKVVKYYDDWAPLKSAAGNYEKIRDDSLGYSSCENYKVIYQTPVTSVNGGYGAVGKIAFIDETTDVEYHPWFNSTWLYYKNATITEAAGDNITNGITDVWLTHDNKVMSDCSDIRVVSTAGAETKFYATGCNSTHAHVYMQYNVSASSTAVYSIYYGNTTAVASTSQASFGAARTGGDSDLFKEEDGSVSEWLKFGTSTSTGGSLVNDNSWHPDGSYSVTLISGTTGGAITDFDAYGMCYGMNSTSGFATAKHPIEISYITIKTEGGQFDEMILDDSSLMDYDSGTQPTATYNIQYCNANNNYWTAGSCLGTAMASNAPQTATYNNTRWGSKEVDLYMNSTFQNTGGGNKDDFWNTTPTSMKGFMVCGWRQDANSRNHTYDNGTILYNVSYAVGAEQSPSTPLTVVMTSPANTTYYTPWAWINASVNSTADTCRAEVDGVNYTMSNTTVSAAAINCYQESANTTNQTGIDGNCGLSYTGAHGYSGFYYNYDKNKTTDGNWTSYGCVDIGGTLHTNYSVPSSVVVGAVLQVKASNVYWNVSIPSDCSNNQALQLKIKMSNMNLSGSYFTTSCFNNSASNWYDIDTKSMPGGSNCIYEEAVLWNTTNTTVHYLNKSLADGNHSARVTCNDTANYNYSSSGVNFTITTATPIGITAISPTNSTYYTSSVWQNITLNITAGVSKCFVSVDGGANTSLTNSSGNWNYLSTLTGGAHNSLFSCNDTALSWYEAPYVYYTYDTTPPQWSLNSTNSTGFTDNIATLFTTTWTDNYDSNGYNFSSFESNYSGVLTNYTAVRSGNASTYVLTNLPVGATSWRFYANDSHNNWNATGAFTLTLASVYSAISVNQTSPENTTYFSSYVWHNASLNVTSNVSSCSVETDGINYTMTNSSGNWNKLLNQVAGNHSSRVICAAPDLVQYATSEIIYTLNATSLNYCGVGNNTLALTMRHYDELTRGPVSAAVPGITLYTSFGNTNYSFNFSANNLTQSICIFPASGTVLANIMLEYSNAATYGDRKYFTWDTNLSYNPQLIDLYSLSSGNATIVTVTLTNAYGDQMIENAVIVAQRWYPELNSYIPVAMADTDQNGRTPMRLQLYDTWYRFLVYQDGKLTATIDKMMLSGDTLTLKTSSEGLDPYWKTWETVTAACAAVNNSGNTTVQCVGADSAGLVRSWNLQVFRSDPVNWTSVCDLTTAASSATINCVLGATGANLYWYTFDYAASPPVAGISGYLDYRSLVTAFGTYGLFLGLLIIMGLGLSGLWNPTVSLTLAGAGMVFMYWAGIFPPAFQAAVMGIVLVIVIAVVRLRS